MPTTTWTSPYVDPPRDHLYGQAVWLLSQHPQLAHLAARVPGVVDTDEEGDPHINLDALAHGLAAHEVHAAAWEQYEKRRPAPRDDASYERWQAAGPALDADVADAVESIGTMSGSERGRLRLLAAFSTVRVPFRVLDFRSFDDNGQQLLDDWCRIVMAG
ncbi:hypothetical protein NUM3379_35080 [Kineococcus sp. NUM-3379]